MTNENNDSDNGLFEHSSHCLRNHVGNSLRVPCKKIPVITVILGRKTKEERTRRGLLAREWVTSDESGMSARQMCTNAIEAMDETFDKFVPRSRFDLLKVEERPKKYVTHKLLY